MQRLSIIVPSLNEAAFIPGLVQHLQPLRARGCEVIVMDGGSADDTPALAAPHVDRMMIVEPGRAPQMNKGAAIARGEVLLFLHADTFLPENADKLILEALQCSGKNWGRFDARIAGGHPLLRVVEFMMNLRSRLTGIATGDQAIFVTHEMFNAVGGFPAIALMEDVALSRQLRRHGPPLCLRQKVATSARRWEGNGVVRTVFLMWWLRIAYFFGADPERLALTYDERKD
ncbi:MAG: TIGR04283 family arsenosugar biosynthesis glycosyltransferase [Burkholderiales bacterium]